MKNDCRHWILSAVLLSTATTALADPCCTPFCGFYLGGSLGGAFFSAREHRSTFLTSDYNGLVTQSPNRFNATVSHTISHAQKKNTKDIAIFTGFACAWEDAFLGIEAFLHNTSYEVKGRQGFAANNETTFGTFAILNASASNRTSLHTRLSPLEPGIDVRPGIFLTPCTVLYGRLGVGYNKLSLHADTHPSVLFSYTPTIQPSFTDGREDRHRRKKMGALRLGIGLEQNLCENVYIRADYVNTHYRGIKVRTPLESYTTTIAPNNTLTYTTTTSARVSSFFNNTVTLGMSYYW